MNEDNIYKTNIYTKYAKSILEKKKTNICNLLNFLCFFCKSSE